MTTIELGNIGSEEQAKRIFEKLNGRTYMNFMVGYAPACGNWPVSVSTEREDTTEEELTSMVLFYLASEI